MMKQKHVLCLLLCVQFLIISAADDADNFFHGKPVRLLESTYKYAPRRVHRIVDTLSGKKVEPRCYPFNYAFFDGESGVGKSTLALAIAYKLRWEAQEFGASDFMRSETRNGTSAAFNRIMSQLEECDENTIIIIDEINHLLMNYDSKHHDTDSSSMSVWLFLDAIKRKSNIFFIGTTNGIGGFPPQIQSRLTGAIVTVIPEKNPLRIKEILLDGLSHEKVYITDEASARLDECIPQLQGHTRNLEHLTYEILGQADEADEYSESSKQDDRLIIKLEHIDAALQVFADLNQRFQKKPYQETDLEQRERHHKEALVQSNRHFMINVLVSTLTHAISLGINIYFNHSFHISATHLQKFLHDGLLQAQTSMHNEALGNQKNLHQIALEAQKELHTAALIEQKTLHNDNIDQQSSAQKIALDAQDCIHKEAAENQKTMHEETMAQQKTHFLINTAIQLWNIGSNSDGGD